MSYISEYIINLQLSRMILETVEVCNLHHGEEPSIVIHPALEPPGSDHEDTEDMPRRSPGRKKERKRD